MRQHKQHLNENAYSILTVDDDPIMTSTIQAYFQRSGYRVDVENDPTRAIERIRQGSYDILLLDFLMSPIRGDQVVEQVRQFDQDLFIILLTGHKSMAPPIKTIRALDIQGYYEKSDRFDQLEMLVESCVKSLNHMRTIKRYKDGLSTILDTLPRIYNLESMERITDNILHTASNLLPCVNVVLALDADHYQLRPAQSGERRFISRAVGEDYSPMSPRQAEELLMVLKGKSSLVVEKFIVLPLLDDLQNEIGLMSIQLKETPKYDQIQLLEIFARQSASAICNARLHAVVQDKNHQLDQAYSQMQESYMEIVSTLRLVVDAKDTYTRGHSDRVSYYALHIARKLGYDEQFCERVRVAGLFHDVGKLSVPDHILLKPGRLTEQEYEVIKAHTRNGVELLSVLTSFRPILPAVLSHHERLDGKGYPDALKGDEIPIEARIIGVADTFDAMTSDRLYRKAIRFQDTMDELERCKGTQLDGKVVDAFQELVHTPSFWKEMQEQLSDCMPNRLAAERIF